MTFEPDLWKRFEWEGTPIYLRDDEPDWFVPNDAGDRILKNGDLLTCDDPEVIRFLSRLPNSKSQPVVHPARGHVLRLDLLKEVWFHITDRCNLMCNTCLFSSSPKSQGEMSTDRILTLAEEAHELGCRVFALTGGEPFIHPGFSELVSRILNWKDSHVFVLTNGLRITSNKALFSSWDQDRVHLQISIDGIGADHDRVRGRGQFERLSTQLKFLKDIAWPFTVSMCVSRRNGAQMSDVVSFAAESGATNTHFMWYFIRGRGQKDEFVAPEELLPHLLSAHRRASELGIGIDNLDSLRRCVFAPSGTRHDGTNAGWESLAVGPDGMVYPTPAAVGIQSCATPISTNLESAWRGSPVLESVRNSSCVHLDSPFRFLLGGGDLDHSFAHAGSWMGDDPFMPLFEKLALWMIAEKARRFPSIERPGLRLKMGDVLETCGAHGDLAMTHSNCLLSAAQNQARASVVSFYTEAARSPKTDILNPASYPESLMAHIPEEFRLRGYGCGSPVLDAAIEAGDSVVDLGCGAGVECFIAAPMVAKTGRVIGVDMLDPMLERARRGKKAVSQSLGYDNLEFKNGLLEMLPLPDQSVDVALSNCVLNLSADKRATFAEIFRILKPGGRLVVSDVVCDENPDARIKNDETLRGECIAGALTQRDLFGILSESGFTGAYAIRRLPYRIVGQHPFFSLTFSAHRPMKEHAVRAMYRGPQSAILTQSGELLPAGVHVKVTLDSSERDDPNLFVLDANGAVTNHAMGESVCCGGTSSEFSSCCSPTTDDQVCCVPGDLPQTSILSCEGLDKPAILNSSIRRMMADCMVCGTPVRYLPYEMKKGCFYCGRQVLANAECVEGHFVCDSCHAEDALKVLTQILLETSETDMIALFKKIRQHPRIPIHGPEHHGMIPGIILATYRNLGGMVEDNVLRSAINRGFKTPGGSCGFLGTCGAAVGVGVGFATILESNPYQAKARKASMHVVSQVLARLAEFEAGRCCQRECVISLMEAGRLSVGVLPIELKAHDPLVCAQMAKNKECIFDRCPFWPKKTKIDS